MLSGVLRRVAWWEPRELSDQRLCFHFKSCIVSVARNQASFLRPFDLFFDPGDGRRCFPSKHWYASIRLHGVSSPKFVILVSIVSTTRTSQLPLRIFVIGFSLNAFTYILLLFSHYLQFLFIFCISPTFLLLVPHPRKYIYINSRTTLAKAITWNCDFFRPCHQVRNFIKQSPKLKQRDSSVNHDGFR
jgi:hypothetical protein